MKKNLKILLICSFAVLSVQSMEDKYQKQTTKRKREVEQAVDDSAKKAKAKTDSSEVSQNTIGWDSLPPEIKQAILLHAAYHNPVEAFQEMARIGRVNRESFDIVHDYSFTKTVASQLLTYDKKESEHCFNSACLKGPENVINAFFAVKVNVNATDRDKKKTALTNAVKRGSLSLVQSLLKKGALVDPIAFLFTKGNKELIDTLLQEGALRSSQSQCSHQFLSAVIRNEKKRVKKLIKQGADVNVCADNKGTALMFAASNGYKEMVAFLLAAGAKLTSHGTGELSCAVFVNSIEIADMLIKKGAQVESQSQSPITLACEIGNPSMVKLLLDNGADVNLVNSKGGTALMFAVNRRHQEVVELLLSRGALINVQDKQGGTALIYAARSGQGEVIDQLLDAGADANLVTSDGQTALRMAYVNGYHEAARLIINRTWGDINAYDEHGYTLLMYSALLGNKREIEMFIDLGADVNAQDPLGKTALTHARENGCDGIAELLIKNGASSA